MPSKDIFFIKHPDPMWIYDCETLKILDVNESAVSIYGYSKQEFLKLTIADIRPADDVAKLRESISTAARGTGESGTWKHRLKSGRIIFVSIRSHDLDFDNKPARMVCARDITSLTERELEKAAFFARQRELTQRLTETLENLSDGFVTLDATLTFTFINREAENILGAERSTLLGKSLIDAFPNDAGRNFERRYSRSLETGKVVRFTDYYPPLAKWFEIHAHPGSDGLAVYFRDVTKQREKDGQLRLLEKAVEHLNDILIITKAEPIDEPYGPLVVYANDAFSQHTGYNREELLGKTTRILQGPNTQMDRLDAMRKSMVLRQPHRTELINYTKSGEEIYLEVEIVPVADDAGVVTHWVSVQRDITDRKLAEDAQQLSNARFETIAKAVNDVVWEWDLIHDGLWWSEALHTQFGHVPGQMASSIDFWKDNIHPDDRKRVVSKIESFLEGSNENWQDEYRFARADGTYAAVIDRGYVMRDVSGAGVRMIGTIMDVTERREMEMRLIHSQKLEALGQLTGGIAHDFNNLLTVIIGNSEILTEQLPVETDLHTLADLTFAAAERGAELTSRLLAFGRRQPLEPKLVEVGHLVQGLESLLKRTLSEDIDLKIISHCDPCIAHIDVGQLETALLNLAINARDAMPDGGHLTVRTDNVWLDNEPEDLDSVVAGHFVMVSVTDSGPGMDQETLDRAFEPFFTTKDVGVGSGLGLSMVHGFLKQSLGRVKISTTMGLGTQIAMYFPLVAASTDTKGDIEILQGPQKPRVGGNEKILVVEDDDMVRMHVALHLKDLGYKVVSAHHGKEALKALRQNEDITLLFTDLVMPGKINGGQLARKARLLRPEIRILFTSGYVSDPSITKGIPGEEVMILNKPYRLSDLARTVRAAIDIRAYK